MELPLASRIEELEARLAAAEQERADLQARLDESERSFAAHLRSYDTLAETLPDIVSRFDRQLRNVYANAQAGRAIGRPTGWYFGKTHAELGLPPEKVAFYEERLRQVFATGERLRFESGSVLGQGIIYDMLFVPEFDAHGEVAFVLGVGRDITDRKRAEEALAARERSFRTLAENSPDLIARWDREMRHLYVNPSVTPVTGAKPEDVMGKTHAELGMPPEAVAFFQGGIRQVFDSGELTIVDFQNPLDPAHPTYFQTQLVPEFGPDGRIESVLGITRDITAIKQAEAEKVQLQEAHIEALRQADRMKDEFLSVVSHELRTPLNFIMGFASILEDELAGSLNAQQKHQVEKILTGSERMLNLVNDLLDVAKLEAGKFSLDRHPADVATLLQEVTGTLGPLAEAKQVALTCELSVTAQPSVDSGRVVQILTNLVSNAIKFTPPGGQVALSAREEADAILFSVQDTGPGIAPEHHAALFQRFKQIDMSSTRAVGGTGLGLAIAKALVEVHGGEIGVDSALGRGAVFWFRLPLTD